MCQGTTSFWEAEDFQNMGLDVSGGLRFQKGKDVGGFAFWYSDMTC